MILSHLAPHGANDDIPLQAPEQEIEKFSYIENPERRIYAAMMSKLDESVAQVVKGLAKKGILNNTIILFLSDNGGPTVGMHATTASNYPFRGVSHIVFLSVLESCNKFCFFFSKKIRPGKVAYVPRLLYGLLNWKN